MKNILAILVAFSISQAWAQETAPVVPPAATVATPVAAAPPAVAPAAPAVAVPQPAPQAAAPAPETAPITLQPNAGDFPPLPPSRPCARPDADGLWKLKDVFEKPRGPTSSDFANNPYQYILFLRDDTYRTFKEVWGEKTPDQVKKELERTPPANVQQFVVQESGIIFFYIDGQNIDSQACFIVANQRGPYIPGEMILMPPEGRIATRLALVYERAANERRLVIEPTPDDPPVPYKKPRRKK
jgi:hypothetical protein